MGTEIQNLKLSEADFRGERFRDHAHDQKGNNDLLILTQPDAIRQILSKHLRQKGYLAKAKAGEAAKAG